MTAVSSALISQAWQLGQGAGWCAGGRGRRLPREAPRRLLDMLDCDPAQVTAEQEAALRAEYMRGVADGLEDATRDDE